MNRKFVKAASADAMLKAFEDKLRDMGGEREVSSATTIDMLDAFQSKIDELQGVGTSTDITASLDLTPDQKEIVWEIAEQYNTSHPLSGDWNTETAHEQHAIAEALEVSEEFAKQIMIDMLGFEEDDTFASTEMSADLCNKYDIEECDSTGMPIESSDKLTDLSKELYDIQIDPKDESVIYEDVHGVFGEPGDNMSLASIKRYWNMNYDNDPSLREGYGQDEGARWLKDTIQWMSPVESCDSVKAAHGDDYFGETEARLYGDLIQEELGGRTVSKRKAKAEKPGGLVYEAKQLGIDDFWDLLEALEGMCYDGRAREIDDSTYEILPKGSDQPIEGADSTGDVFMLMGYSSDAESGMDGDEFNLVGKFFAPSYDDAVKSLAEARTKYPEVFEDVNHGSYHSSYYVDEYNDYFDDGSEVFSDFDSLAQDVVNSHENRELHEEYDEEGNLVYN